MAHDRMQRGHVAVPGSSGLEVRDTGLQAARGAARQMRSTFLRNDLFLAPPGLDLEFFRVGGILIQHIDGFTLDSLLRIKELSPDTDYHGLIQHVVDVTKEVNSCGVINYDCVPHNIIAQTGSMQPFEFDFSDCFFREDFASDDEYIEEVMCCSNYVASGGVVAMRLNREFNLGVNPTWFDLRTAESKTMTVLRWE